MLKLIKYLLIVIVLVIVACLSYYWYVINAPAAGIDRQQDFVVAKGDGVNQISQKLSDQGLIKSMFFFETYVWLNKTQSKFLAGEYLLNKKMNIKEVTKELTSGKVVSKERNIKIIEGWKISDINEYLTKEGVINDGSFKSLVESKVSDWQLDIAKPDFLKSIPSSANFEGFLFPDTYRIYKDSKASDIVVKMLDNFDKKLTPAMQEEIARQGKSVYDIITLASVVEKEVKKTEDMKIVSGIFLNRIKSGQPLQSCATLAYIIGENKKQYTVEDTNVDSPYNTYRNKGLPPGPICNPGLDAIKAAIYPEDTDYNYFLNRFDNGETIFSKTYDEHLKNKNKYLQ